jgi:Lrp/AsnC family transcriptional regulator, leucine-responsive regulatory protein
LADHENRLLFGLERAMPRKLPATGLDASDRRILGVLQKEGRVSNVDLARQVGLSPAACHARVKRLEEVGVIDAYVALLNPSHLGRAQSVFVQISLTAQSGTALEAFERQVVRSPFVRQCHLMSGSYDYLIEVMVRDAQEYERLHHDFLTVLPNVARVTSSFALRTVRRTTEAPIV